MPARQLLAAAAVCYILTAVAVAAMNISARFEISADSKGVMRLALQFSTAWLQ
jgi:hypothetical protein